MAAVTVSRNGDRLIAVKLVPAERSSDIEREAEFLRRLDHPGVVRFVDLVETPDGDRALHTEFVSSDTWATRPLTDPSERAAGMAALAAVVADLHDLGVAHRQLTAAHVLHGDGDRPVLCGLTRADEATSDNRRTDLAALADLCHDDAIGRGPLTGKLSSLADAARAGRLGARDLARRLDQLLAKRSPTPEPVRAGRGGGLDLRRRPPRRVVMAGSALLAVVGAVVALTGLRNPGPETRVTDSPDDATLAPEVQSGRELTDSGLPAPASGSTAATAAETTAAESGEAMPVGTGPDPTGNSQTTGTGLVDPTGNSQKGGTGPVDPTGNSQTTGTGLMPEASAAVASADRAGAVIDHRGRRYAVGVEGDHVVTGDWNCDGEATPAIVRPDTGEVVLFDRWPSPGETVSMPARWEVDSPTGAEAYQHDSCDLLRVLTATGSKLFDPKGVS